MIRFLCDEDIDGRVLRGLQRRYPELDITSINDLGLKGASDPDVLRVAIEQDRVLLTHDVRTMRPLARRFIESGIAIPGLVCIDRNAQMGTILDDLATIAVASHEDEWRDQIMHVPL